MQLVTQKQTMENLELMLEKRELILYGRSKYTKEICSRYKVKYIVEKNDELWDKKVNGISIYPVEQLYNEEAEKVMIVICEDEKKFLEITEELLSIDSFDVFYWHTIKNDFLREFSNKLFDNYERIKKVENSLTDCFSKKIYREVIHRRIIGCCSNYADLKMSGEMQYLFSKAFFSKREGAILDCGAYIGDSVDRLIWAYGKEIDKIYSFEAIPANVVELEKKRDELKTVWAGDVVIIPKALADSNRRITFFDIENKDASYSPDFRDETRCVSDEKCDRIEVETCVIDEVIPESESVRYIKMDVEGAEYETLVGAKSTIKREKPGLAISIYHNAEDYYRLAELILSYVPEYHLAVRHHKTRHVDTVLYAWV